MALDGKKQAHKKKAVKTKWPRRKHGDQAVQRPGEDAEIQKLVDVILEKNGPQQQAVILIEEMAELTHVLCKIQRGKFDRGKLNEEFTHVRVSCEVIRRVMGVQTPDVTAEVKAKLAEYAGTA